MKGAVPSVKMQQVYLAATPFIIMDILVIGLLIAFPGIATVFAGLVR
jgi:TRAP-type mannitol/chloroaromatic compound transport system permease large subunit